MDPLQERVARIGLELSGRYGFALAGGSAVQQHGLSDRPTQDVDLFTNDPSQFDEAVESITQGLRNDGLTVTEERRFPEFAQLTVTDPTDNSQCGVDIGRNWRSQPPAQLDIGPVLSADDSVAGKMFALWDRAAPRDFLDVDSALQSGRYTRHDLLGLAADADPGFTPERFNQRISAELRHLGAEDVAPYGTTPEQLEAMRARFQDWSSELEHTSAPQEVWGAADAAAQQTAGRVGRLRQQIAEQYEQLPTEPPPESTPHTDQDRSSRDTEVDRDC